jgi:hypothetical protein
MIFKMLKSFFKKKVETLDAIYCSELMETVDRALRVKLLDESTGLKKEELGVYCVGYYDGAFVAIEAVNGILKTIIKECEAKK